MAEKQKLKLNEMQQKAVQHKDGPLLIVAGAGSGKTRTLAGRLIHLLESGVKSENIIAITFTNKAAREMESRIKNKELWGESFSNALIHNSKFIIPYIGTFHSLGARILKDEANIINRTSFFTIYDEDDSLNLIKDILKKRNLSKERFNPLQIQNKISKIKNELINVDEEEFNDLKDQIIVEIYRDYEAMLRQSNAFDFDDLIEKVVRIWQNHPEILEKYRSRWQHILIDEFQDVNSSQYILVKLLAEKHKNIFAIGDDQQSIYGFRGSDFKNFLNFEQDWSNTTIIKLEENYRSTKNIIDAASELIKNNKYQKSKELWTKNEDGSIIKIAAYQNSEEEAWGLAQDIVNLVRQGTRLPEIAILYRTNAQSRAIEQALIRTRIPYEIFGGLKFYARKEIKDLIAAIRYTINPQDIASINRLEKNFTKSQNKTFLSELPKLKELSMPEIIKFFIEKTDYIEYLEKNFKNPEERKENVNELINFSSTFQDARIFLEQVALMGGSDGRPKFQENAVRLMTIHLAKGLEFPNVFIAGVNDGLLPHERSMFKSEELEEERRLMYVAMTRAQKNLHLSFYNLPSRFLGEIPAELVEFTKISEYGREKTDWDDETIYIE